jgi:hypothetical protein
MERQPALSFATTDDDMDIIGAITLRAAALGKRRGGDPDPLFIARVITMAHASACRLDLQRLLDARNDDFAYDIINIMRHLDRATGKFRGGFHPRCAAQDAGLS